MPDGETTSNRETLSCGSRAASPLLDIARRWVEPAVQKRMNALGLKPGDYGEGTCALFHSKSEVHPGFGYERLNGKRSVTSTQRASFTDASGFHSQDLKNREVKHHVVRSRQFRH